MLRAVFIVGFLVRYHWERSLLLKVISACMDLGRLHFLSIGVKVVEFWSNAWEISVVSFAIAESMFSLVLVFVYAC